MKRLKGQKELVILIVLTVLAGFFRFYNINWDQGNYFQPDERNIANAVSQIHLFDALDPHFFAYGGFTIYLYNATGSLINTILHEEAWTADWSKINIIGRTWSAFFSTFTLIPLYFLARRLFGQKTATIAGILYVFTAYSIQSAHFATTESLLALFTVLAALVSLRVIEKPTTKNFLLLGGLCGLAAATKTSALSLLVFPAVAFYQLGVKSCFNWFQLGRTLILFALTALIVFTVFSPYTFLSWDQFTTSMDYESGVTTGRLPVVYTLQFKGTLPYLFYLQNLLWQMGPQLIFALAGTGLLAWQTWQKRNLKLALLLAFPLAYFAYVGSWYAKFIRYMMPVIPLLVVFAAVTLVWLENRFKLVGRILLSLTLVLTFIWASAFFTIYTRPQTKILASEWIYSHVSPGSLILQEHWDDGLPIPLGDLTPNLYQIYQLTIYDPDNNQKAVYYANWLSQGDYLEISSRRLYGTLTKRSDQYPLTSYYYYLLFGGKLGYQKVAQFDSYPQVLGYPINDDTAEETFQVFDHPKVLIFKNTGHFSALQIYNILTRSNVANRLKSATLAQR